MIKKFGYSEKRERTTTVIEVQEWLQNHLFRIISEVECLIEFLFLYDVRP